MSAVIWTLAGLALATAGMATAAMLADLASGVLARRERLTAIAALAIVGCIVAELVRVATGALPVDGVATASMAMIVMGYSGLRTAMRGRHRRMHRSAQVAPMASVSRLRTDHPIHERAQSAA